MIIGKILSEHRLQNLLPLLLIVTCGVIAYSNTFSVPFHFDDVPNIADNVLIKDAGLLTDPSSYCSRVAPRSDEAAVCDFFKRRYVGYLSFALNYRMNGLHVAGYHVVNLFIHIMNAILVYGLVMITFRTPHFSEPRPHSPGDTISQFTETGGPIALFSALLFVCHPLQTQAVTYVVQRFASLATFFYLLSLVMYIKCRLLPHNHSSPVRLTIRRSSLYGISLVSALLAMKTKETAFTLPIAIAVYELIFLDGEHGKRVAYLVPFILTMIVIPLSVIGEDKPIGLLIGDTGNAARVHTDIPREDYLFTEFTVITRYVRLIFFPYGQNLDYDYPVFRSFLSQEVFLSFLFLAAILCGGACLLWRSRSARPNSPDDRGLFKLISFGIFWFFIALSVESSIIPIVDVIFEHRVYLPSVGAFVAIAASLWFIRGRIKRRWSMIDRGMTPVFIAIIIILMGLTHARNIVWQSDTDLWADVVKKSPHNARGHYNWGVALKDGGDLLRAQKEWERTLEIDPFYSSALTQLGNVYYLSNSLLKAKEYYEKSLRLNYDNNAEAHYNLAMVLENLDQADEAVVHYEAFLNTFSPVYGSLVPQVREKLSALKGRSETKRRD